MTDSDTIDRAVRAIGGQESDDYILRPTQHADSLETEAPALAGLLRRSSLSTVAERYERLDDEASGAQKVFKKTLSQANAAVLLAGVLSAATMVIGVLHARLGVHVADALLLVCGVSALVAGGLAAMWLFRVREGRLLETWMTRRADAETARLEYFNEVLRTPGDAPSSIPLALLKLEYFRRYQLDVQLAYYGTRRQQHATSASRTLMLGGMAALAGSITAGAAGVLGVADVALTAFAGLGVVGTALAAFASTREAMNQDRRNAERYARTLDSLERLKGKLSEVREAAPAEDGVVLADFVAAVHEQLSLEHRQWQEAGESSESAAARLEKALASTRSPAATP